MTRSRSPAWQTFDTVNGIDLARTLRMVQGAPRIQLPQISNKTREERLAFEEQNNRASFAYATAELGLQ